MRAHSSGGAGRVLAGRLMATYLPAREDAPRSA